MTLTDNKKFYIKSVVAVVIVAVMVGLSEITHEKEIIFPEIAAIAVGYFIAPNLSWKTSKIRTLIFISVCSVLGVLITNYVPLPDWMQMMLAFLVAQFILEFSKTTFAPMISAIVLPVLLGTKSIIYPISAIGLTSLILLVVCLLEKVGVIEKTQYDADIKPQKKDFIDIALRFLFGGLMIFTAMMFSWSFIVAPPLLVAFTEFTNRNSKARKHPVKAVALISVCALIGTLLRYLICIKLSLPLTLAAVITIALVIIALKTFKMYLPPAGALAILPMLIPDYLVLVYPLEIVLGCTLFMAFSLFVFKNKKVKPLEEEIKVK